MKELMFSFENYRLNKLLFTTKALNGPKGNIEISPAFHCRYHFDKSKLELDLGVEIQGENLPFTIDVSFTGVFIFSEDLETIETKKREKIIEVNCTASLFPFIRETIAETTMKAGLKPLLLPLVNFLQAYNDKKESDKVKSKCEG